MHKPKGGLPGCSAPKSNNRNCRHNDIKRFDLPLSRNRPLKSVDDLYIGILKDKVKNLGSRRGNWKAKNIRPCDLHQVNGATRSYMYIDAVQNRGVLQLYSWHELFCNIIFWVVFLLGGSPASEFYVSLHRLWRWKRQSVPKRRHKIQTPGNDPKEIIQHSEHCASLKSRIVF